MKETMIITRNTKTTRKEEEEEEEEEEENTTAYLFFHMLSKSLFIRFTFVFKLWYNIFHDHSPTLSDDIIFFRILNQLPSKSLLRFSCVSKLWYNTIHHDPFFIDSHYNHSKTKPASHVLISASYSETHFNFNYLDQEQHQGASSSSYTLVANFKNDRRLLIGSANCLTCFSTTYFIEVCNPSTHEILGIPYPPTVDVYAICCYGFGFDPLMNQYKVLLVIRERIETSYQIFTLGPRAQEDCIWRDITVTTHLSALMEWELFMCEHPLIFSNGALFMVSSCTNTIIMFDIHYEKFQVIPGPQISGDDELLYTVCEFRGCPYAVYRAYLRYGYEFSFYALKKVEQSSSNSNVGSSSSSSSIHFVFEQAVRFPVIIPNFELLRVLSFTEFSGQILMQWFDISANMQFYVYNPHTKKLQKGVIGLSLGSYGYSALFVKHVDNLLSLKKLVPLSPPSAPPATEVKYLSSREATMYDEGTSTTLSPLMSSILCCFGLSAKKHRQDMNQCDHISRFKSRQL